MCMQRHVLKYNTTPPFYVCKTTISIVVVHEVHKSVCKCTQNTSKTSSESQDSVLYDQNCLLEALEPSRAKSRRT